MKERKSFKTPYLCVIPRKHFLRHRCNIFQEELVPLFFKVDLIHVNINSGDVLVATLDPSVLQNGEIM